MKCKTNTRLAVVLLLLCLAGTMMLDNNELRAAERLRHSLTLKNVTCFTLSADGKYLAGGAEPGQICIWQMQDGTLIKSFAPNAGVRQVAFSQSGEILSAALSNRTVEVWEVGSARRIRSDAHERRLSDVVFFPDNKSWITATGSKGGTVTRWTLDAEKPQVVFDESASPMAKALLSTPRVTYVYELQVSPDGRTFAVALWSGVLTIDSATGNEKAGHRINSTATIALDFSDDGSRLAVGMGSGAIRVLSADLEHTLFSVDVGSSLVDVALSPDGKHVAAARSGGNKNDSVIEIYRVEDRAQLGSFVCHSDIVQQVDFAPNGQLVSCALDGNVRIWQLGIESQ